MPKNSSRQTNLWRIQQPLIVQPQVKQVGIVSTDVIK